MISMILPRQAILDHIGSQLYALRLVPENSTVKDIDFKALIEGDQGIKVDVSIQLDKEVLHINHNAS